MFPGQGTQGACQGAGCALRLGGGARNGGRQAQGAARAVRGKDL